MPENAGIQIRYELNFDEFSMFEPSQTSDYSTNFRSKNIYMWMLGETVIYSVGENTINML